MKIRTDPLDILVSKIIRLRANGKCERCLRPTEFNRLQAAHFIGRANRKTRYDLQNLCGLCFGCHQYLDSRFLEKAEFVEKYLGKTEYEKLKQRANWPSRQKVDKVAIKLFLERELARLEKLSGQTN